MSGEEANLSSARKIPDSLKCPAGGGWKFKTLSRQEEQPDPAQAGFPVPRWALHTDLTWQGIKYLKLQKVVVVQELLFPPGEAQSVLDKLPLLQPPYSTAQGLAGKQAPRNGRREKGQPKSKVFICKGLFFLAN